MCRKSWYIGENAAHEARADGPDPEEALPPYFGISPDEALRRARAPGRHPRPRRDRRRSAPAAATTSPAAATSATAARRLRLFSTWEITRYLIPVAQAHFRRVLRQNPALPQGRTETPGGAKWFTLDEVLRLRAHFAAEGSRAKPYAPWRPAGLPAKVAAIANFKGGVGKTSMAAHLAMSAALDGYRVLVVDLDSQGSMTSIFGGKVASEWDTVFPLDRPRLRPRAPGREPPPGRARRRAAAPRRDPRRRARASRRADVIQQDPLAEHRPDRRPAQPLLGRVPDPGLAHEPARLEALGGARTAPSSATASSTRYDLVILDTPPALGYLTINGLTAADILLGAARRLLPRVRLHRALLRHAALDLRLDRGRREHGRPRPRPPGDPLRMGRGARRRHPLRRRPAGRARRR